MVGVSSVGVGATKSEDVHADEVLSPVWSFPWMAGGYADVWVGEGYYGAERGVR